MVLDGGDRHDRAGSLDLLYRDLGNADVPDLAAVTILLDGGEAFLNRCLRVDPVQVVESDAVGAQAAEALLDFGAEILGRPRPAPPAPPFVATMQLSGTGESAAPIVLSLSPLVYE